MTEPQAPEDEREHCARVLGPLWDLENPDDWEIAGFDNHVELLVHERAAARAEGVAEGLNNRALNAGCVTLREYLALRAKYDAVRTELAALKGHNRG